MIELGGFYMQPEACDIYCTSYCNRAHRLSDGKPIEHECYVLPVEMLAAERAGNTYKAVEILQGKRRALQTNTNLAKWQMALNTMVELIDNGYEYPTAHCKVCAKYELSEEEAARVTEEYDNL